MSSHGFALPLRLDCRPSRYLLWVMVAVHGAALLALLPLPIDWWLKPPIAVAILVQGIIVWENHINFSSPHAVTRMVWSLDNRWALYTVNGAIHVARLLPTSYVHPWLVILRFVTEDNRRCAVILPLDGLGADSHRRLRALLRLNGGEKKLIGDLVD